jgi:hypothetical protein
MCLIILIFSFDSFAAPSISEVSGGIIEGETVTIAGSGFGTKSPAAPLIWDTLEDGSVNTSTTSLDRDDWDSTSTFSATSGDKHGGTYSALSSGPNGGGHFDIETNVGDSAKLYFYTWRRYSTGMSQANLNKKFWGMLPTGGSSYPRPAAAWHGSELGKAGKFIVEPNLYGTKAFSFGDLPGSSWFLDEFIVQLSSGSGQRDGIWQYIQDGSTKANYTDVVYRNGTYPTQPSQVSWRNDGIYSGNLYMDDLYIDTMWSRVMVGNNSSYSSCTHREIQIPMAWAGNSITITVNQGSFADCETVYLFVVDADGNVNTQGYPIRIVTGAGKPPCPPIGGKISK